MGEQVATLGTDVPSISLRGSHALIMMVVGFLIGWGPIPTVLMVVGVVILVSRCLRQGRTRLEVVVLVFSLTALGTYFGLSFFMAADPNFISVVNLSTIARLSDEATLAYFLATPFLFGKMRSRRASVLVLASLIIFGVAAAPVYASALQTRMCEGYTRTAAANDLGRCPLLNATHPVAGLRSVIRRQDPRHV